MADSDPRATTDGLLSRHGNVLSNPDRPTMIAEVVSRREAMVAECGCLATWTPPESTGRSPQDTVIVRRPESEKNIDWDSPNNLPLAPENFDMILDDTVKTLGSKDRLYVADRVLGADPKHALLVRVVTDRALTVPLPTTCSDPCPRALKTPASPVGPTRCLSARMTSSTRNATRAACVR